MINGIYLEEPSILIKKSDFEIFQKEYKRILERSKILDCLEAAGVDNWEGYDFAMEEYYE